VFRSIFRRGDFEIATSEIKSLESHRVALRHDLTFLRAANDVHNMHYAAKLNQTLLDRASSLCRELKVPEPKATLTMPPPMKAGR
jgi:hypothetical protein